MKRFLTIFTLLPLLLSSCEENVPSLSSNIPSLEKVEVVDNGGLVFELKCICSNSFAISECGFYVSEKPSMQDADKHPSKMTGDSFSAEVTLKGYSRKYYVCAFISNGRTEILSDSKIISISSLDNYVTFGTVGVDSYDRETGITTFSASCSVAEGVEVTGYGILWGDSSDLTTSGTSMELTFPVPDAPVSFELPGLKLGDKLYICQYITEKNNTTVYGKTEELDILLRPAVTTASVSGITYDGATCGGTVTDDGGASETQRGVVWSTSPNPTVSLSTKTEDGSGKGSFTSVVTGLSWGTTYYLRAYATNSMGTSYGEEKTFRTLVALPSVSTGAATSVTSTSAILNATLVSDGGETPSECGFYWGQTPFSETSSATKVISTVSGSSFTAKLSNLARGTTYYYRAYAINSLGISYGEQIQITTLYADPMSPSNCFIISASGIYCFMPVKGNSNISVGTVSSVVVLWESFGTSVTPSTGALVKNVSYNSGYILFEASAPFREGNALIAAKDASGNILWSWHIWLTDQPKGQTYNNNAGVMMDRNLGATSSINGDVGALGLLYQWGRKDPFLGSSSISSSTEARSTITWPSPMSSSSSTGTISFATSHPTTFIKYNSNNYDWYYSTDDSTDNTRWQSSKTIYDPCPAGWRVPDGGSNGVWSKAFGTSSSWETSSNWDSSNKGMDFSRTDKKLGSSGPIWYPASGYRFYSSGALYDVGSYGGYWSVSPNGEYAYYLGFYYNGYVNPANSYDRAFGRAVRCLQE